MSYVPESGEQNEDFGKNGENRKNIIRTIATNFESMYALNCELILRGVDIFGSEPEGQRNQFAKNYCGSQSTNQHIPFGRLLGEREHHVVLVGEKDTRYSRELTKSFVKSMTNLKDEDIHIAQNRVHTFSYLRGIDGVKDGATQNNDDESRKDDRKPGEWGATKNITKIHRPEDAYQFDYVRRLAGRLERLQQELSKREVKGEIKAIGILGSDPYDKLLILQALHKKFPQVIFFTTDLDARLLHPDQAPWTRNLIVASSYGLELHDDLQQGAPPFRDNYQTALYLTTQFAALCRKEWNEIACENPSRWNKERSLQEIFDSINAKSKDVSNKVGPSRLFEIGNHGAVDISLVSGDGIHPAVMPDSIQLPHFVFLMLFLIVLTILLKEFVPRRKFPTIVLTVAGLLFVAWVFVLLRLSGAWWMYFIYLIIFLGALAVFLNYLLQGTPRKIVLCMIGGFAAIAVIYILCGLTAIPSLDTFSFNDGISTWPANAMRSFAFFMAGCFCFLVYVQQRKCVRKIKCDLKLGRVMRDEKGFRYPEQQVKEDTPEVKLLIDNWGNRPNGKSVLRITNLWHGLGRMVSLQQQGVRVFAMLLLYVACVLLLLLTGFVEIPEIPARGRVDFFVTQAVLILLVLAYLVLIFIIADIAHLASHLIGLLKSNDYNWPFAKLMEYRDRYGSTELARQKLKIDLIHRIAKEINGFVYYPFVVLFLLILSRSHFFDNWHYTPFLFFVFCFTAILALLSAARLRWAAIAARDEVLTAVQAQYWLLQSQGNAHKECAKLLVDEIKSLDSGAFLPLSKHPVFLSVLLPLSSIGGLYLIEYMLTAS